MLGVEQRRSGQPGRIAQSTSSRSSAPVSVSERESSSSCDRTLPRPIRRLPPLAGQRGCHAAVCSMSQRPLGRMCPSSVDASGPRTPGGVPNGGRKSASQYPRRWWKAPADFFTGRFPEPELAPHASEWQPTPTDLARPGSVVVLRECLSWGMNLSRGTAGRCSAPPPLPSPTTASVFCPATKNLQRPTSTPSGGHDHALLPLLRRAAVTAPVGQCLHHGPPMPATSSSRA